MADKKLTFWEHLDELRGVLVRATVAIVVVGCVAFCLKDQLFSIIFAAQSSDFVTYRILDGIITELNLGEPIDNFSVGIINTKLTEQFTTHITVAMWAGFLIAFPYILYELFRFVSPALYSTERRYTAGIISWGYIMFLLGVAMSYFLIFPLTFRFLATYQVNDLVVNMIALDSYIGTLVTLCLMVGILFELPILCYFFAKLGFITVDFMRKYRRHAVVILLIISAVITPTADIITLLLVALPIYLLYEFSILVVGAAATKRI